MKTKAFAAIVALFLLLASLIYTFRQQESPLPSQQPPLVVSAISAQSFSIFDEIEALGNTFAFEAVDVTAATTDKIAEIFFDDGQFVRKNDVLVLLEQDEENAQKEVILAQKAENERELNRLESLLKRNATAQNEYDERKTLLAISNSRLEEVKARIRDKTIRAPFDGVLGLRKISVGSLVEPGTLITTIDDISKIKLDFTVPATYLDVVKPGLEIKAVSSSLSRAFSGRITMVSSRVNRQTRAAEARAILANPDGLIKPGLLLSVTLLRNQRNAIVIPEEAIIQLQNEHFVYTINNKQVEKIKVLIGRRAAGWVEITEGLSIGDTVMTHGQIRTRPNATVETNIKTFNPFE